MAKSILGSAKFKPFEKELETTNATGLHLVPFSSLPIIEVFWKLQNLKLAKSQERGRSSHFFPGLLRRTMAMLWSLQRKLELDFGVIGTSYLDPVHMGAASEREISRLL